MFKLFRLNEDKYLILVDGKEIEGSRRSIMTELRCMRVEASEILLGIAALETGHDMADYGINRTFIFSASLWQKVG